jgi:hypothetical protein
MPKYFKVQIEKRFILNDYEIVQAENAEAAKKIAISIGQDNITATVLESSDNFADLYED